MNSEGESGRPAGVRAQADGRRRAGLSRTGCQASSAAPIRAEELRLSTETIRGLPMGVLPDESDPADGLLGMDALSRYLVVLDREQMRLKLLAPEFEPLSCHW